MFEDQTVESIKAEMLTDAAAAYPGVSTREGSFLDVMAGPFAAQTWRSLQMLNAVVPIAFPDESSGGYIDLAAAPYGITRAEGARATAPVTLTGKPGTEVAKGTAFLTADGLVFLLTAAARLDGAGSARGTVEAEAVGTAYNVDPGALVRMYANVPGLEGYESGRAEGGVDPESDASLMGRLDARRGEAPTSNNEAYYRQLALDIPGGGVGAAKVFRATPGPGGVLVVIAGPELGPVDEAVTARCGAYIQEQHIIGASVAVQSARGRDIDVGAVLTLAEGAALQAVTDTFRGLLREYLRSVAFAKSVVSYNQIHSRLMDVEGVVDFSGLTVNGGVVNVALEQDQVPVVGRVALEVGA